MKDLKTIMKISLSILIILFCVAKLSAQILSEPATAFVNSGLYHIAKIEKTKTNTIVDLKISFIPGWWTSFDSDVFIEDVETKQKYMLDSLQGIAMGKKITTPISGDTSVRLFFPPIAKNIKSINFGSSKSTSLYGISLTGSKTKKKPKEVPKAIQKWLQEQIAASKTKHVKGIAYTSFFDQDSATIVGYIRGYDSRSGFSSGIVYTENTMTNESLPATIRILPDGRFTVRFEIFHPTMNNLLINERWFSFYAEPGHTIGVILDWEDFLQLDRFRDRSYSPQFTRYLGPLSKINEEINYFKVTPPNYKSLTKDQKTLDPTAFKKKTVAAWDQESTALNERFEKYPASVLAKHLIQNTLNLYYANYLFDYASDRAYYSKQDTANAILKIPIDSSYYDFVNRIDLNDHALLASNDFSIFLNRMEYSPLYPRSMLNQKEGETAIAKAFKNIYKTDELPLSYHLMSLRQLSSQYKRLNISDTLLQKQADKFLSDAPSSTFATQIAHLQALREQKKVGYSLPDTPAARIFKNVIDAHAGKVLIVDFWAQSCGPCRSNIESSVAFREKWKDHPDLDFIFITDESGTPDINFFTQYSAKNFMKNSYRVTSDEYLALRELFRFNGIPHYVLVDVDGKIRDDNFSYYNTVSNLKMNFPEKFAELTN